MSERPEWKLLVWTANEEMLTFEDDEFGEVLALPGGVLHITDVHGSPHEGVTGTVALAKGPRMRVTVTSGDEKRTEEPLESVMRYLDGYVVGRYSEGERWKKAPFTGGTVTRITRLEK